MKNRSLTKIHGLLMLFIVACMVSCSPDVPQQHLGAWKNLNNSGPQESLVILDQEGNYRIQLDKVDIATDSKGNVGLEYQIDYDKDPIQFDIINKETKTPIYKCIVRFTDSNHMELQMPEEINGNRPVEFQDKEHGLVAMSKVN